MGSHQESSARTHHHHHVSSKISSPGLSHASPRRSPKGAAPLLATALEVVSRASTSSEVLSLNLTNLIILIALKVAIIVFGLVSGGGVTGRSGDAPNALTQSDLTGGMCFLLYTGGDESKLSCIARAACESPSEADNYLSAAKLWYKMSKLIKAVPFNIRYTSIMETVYDAAEHSKNGGECTKYNW